MISRVTLSATCVVSLLASEALAAPQSALTTNPFAPVVRREVAIAGARASDLGFTALTHFAVSQTATSGVFDIIVSGTLTNQIFPTAKEGTWDSRGSPGTILVNNGTLDGVNCSPSKNKSIVISDGVTSSGNTYFPSRPVIHTEGSGDLPFRPLGCPQTTEFAAMRAYCPQVFVLGEPPTPMPPAPPMQVFVAYISGGVLGNEVRCTEINIDQNWRPGGTGTPCQDPCGSLPCSEVVGFEKGAAMVVLDTAIAQANSILRFLCLTGLVDGLENPVGLVSTGLEIGPGSFQKSLFWSGDFTLHAASRELTRIEIPSGSQILGSGNALLGTTFYIRPVAGSPGDSEVVRLDMVALSIAAAQAGQSTSLRAVMPYGYPDGQGVMVMFTGTPSPVPVSLPGFDGALYLDPTSLTSIFVPVPIVGGSAAISFTLPPGLPPGLELPVQAVIPEFVGGNLIGGVFTNLSKIAVRP